MTRPMAAPSSQTTFDMTAVLEQLDKVLDVDQRPVTSRWLCYEAACNTEVAQTALKQCVDRSGNRLAVTYLLTGTHMDTGMRMVRLVAAERLAAARQVLTAAGQAQIYAVSPRHPPADAMGLHAQDLEQAQKLMKRIVENKMDKQAEAFANNLCSLVRGAACKRQAVQEPPLQPAVAATTTAAPTSKPAGPSAANLAPAQAKSDITSADANPDLSAVVGGKGARASAPQLTPPPSGSEAPKTTGSALASAFSKAPKKAAKAPTKAGAGAKASAAASATSSGMQNSEITDMAGHKRKPQVLDDDERGDEEDMDSQSPLPTRAAAPRKAARLTLLQDDSEDDFDAPTAVAPSAGKPGKGAAAKGPGGRGATGKRDPPHPVSPSKASKKARQVEATPASLAAAAPAAPPSAAAPHSEYGTPPDPDAEIKLIMGKPFWSFINDNGEEVTMAAAKPTAASAPVATKSRPEAAKGVKQDSKSTPKASSAAAKASEPKKKGSKAAKGMAGVGDIRSMFGKR